MRTFNEFINEKEELDSQYYAELGMSNVQKIYQVAMRAKDAKSLKTSMLKYSTISSIK